MKNIERTKWAKNLKKVSPDCYEMAIQIASTENLEVEIFQTNETGETMWAIHAVNDPGFWLDAFPSRQRAINLCKTMGWVIASVYENEKTTIMSTWDKEINLEGCAMSFSPVVPWKPFLIGIAGPKEHGKSTLAKVLEQRLPVPESNVSHLYGWLSAKCWEFADPMIEMAKILTQDSSFSKHKIYEITPGKSLTGTQVLQILGTEGIRKTFGMNTWTHYLHKLITEGRLKNYAWIIVPGMRMPEEYDMMDYKIWLEAPGVVSQQNINHETELHHRMLKERSNLSVQRFGDQYSINLETIIEDIVRSRKLRDQLVNA